MIAAKSYHKAIALGAVTLLGACQKVIHIDLNSSSPQYVIEGNITNIIPGADSVKISRSVNFDQDNVFPAVSGALVTITDNTAGLTDTLHEQVQGTYTTTSLAGVPGHKYELYIKADGRVFTAECIMPQHVTLDSLYAQKSSFRGNYSMVPVYTDPATKGNYYQFYTYVNGVASDAIYIRNDNLVNGTVVNQPLNSRGAGTEIAPGDNVAVYLSCIDSAVYQYFYTMQQTKNQNSATPANPQTNIKGGALGYFSARTLSNKNIVVH